MRTRALAALLASICGGLLLAAGGAATPRSSDSPQGLVLWNKLGSAYQVTHSARGPNLTRYNCHDRTTPSFGEHGAVEAWYRQRRDPVPFVDNPHLIFGGPYDVGDDDVNLFVQDRVDSGDPRLHFSVYFGGGLVWARSLSDHQIGYSISSLNRTWIHVAGVWDRRGIAGSRDTVRLYANGALVAASQKTGWGAKPCGRRKWGRHLGDCFIGVAGCNDTCAGTFAVDELKVWSYAKTDFG